MNIDILLGKTQDHLIKIEGSSSFIHKQALHDFLKLKKEAESKGFKLEIASSFRDFERQLRIWNLKAEGKRPIFDDFGKQIEISSLSPVEIMFSILRWSAVPGASRHHWGTDIDVFDANTQELKNVQLTPSECEGDGPAAKLHLWLDELIEAKASYGFYRPYKRDLGGVSPERWHLSYDPISSLMMESYSFSLFKKNIEESEMKLKEELLLNVHEIFHRYFLNIDPP